MIMTVTTVCILTPKAHNKRVAAKLRKLTKRAHTTFSQVEGTTKFPVKDDAGNPAVFEFDRWEIGDIKEIAGHKMVARIEHTEAGNIVSCFPGQSAAEFRTRNAKPVCDHCNTVRARRDTFLFRRADGTIAQVGRNCLAMYLGVDPARVIAAANLVAFIREVESMDRDGSFHLVADVARFVACVVASHEEFGFRKADQDESTKSDATWRMWRPSLMASEGTQRAWRKAQPTDKQCERAEALIEWARNLEDSGDYANNLRVAASLDDVRRNAGILASLPQAWERANGIESKRAKEKAERAASEHFGEVKKRAEYTLTYARIVSWETDFYGTQYLHCFVDQDGNRATWKTNTGALWPDTGDRAEIGDTITVKATVKDHTEYKGTKQTVLARVKVLSVAKEDQKDAA